MRRNTRYVNKEARLRKAVGGMADQRQVLRAGIFLSVWWDGEMLRLYLACLQHISSCSILDSAPSQCCIMRDCKPDAYCTVSHRPLHAETHAKACATHWRKHMPSRGAIFDGMRKCGVSQSLVWCDLDCTVGYTVHGVDVQREHALTKVASFWFL
jgi:hypothetical protein